MTSSSSSYVSTATGRNHKNEEILKLYSGKCPFCNKYMRYFEFLFNVVTLEPGPSNNADMNKLVVIQQFEEIIEKIKRGEKIELTGLLIGCEDHYLNTPKKILDKNVKKPYIVIDAEGLWKFNNTNISHIYLAERI